MSPLICPDSIIVRLRFNDITAFTSGTSGSYVYAINDVYDPNVTGVGAQPLGFDQWCGLYQRFEVLKSTILVEFTNSDATDNVRVAIVPTISSSSPSLINASTMARSKYGIMGGIGGISFKRLVCTVSPRALIGRNTNSVNYTGSSTASPASLVYWHVLAASMTSTTLNTVQSTEVTYTVKFYDRVSLSGS
jgi:hypothetical protein